MPLRNIAIVLTALILSLFWFWYSWSPFFPSVGACLSKQVVFIYNKLTSKSTNQASKILKFLLNSLDIIAHKLRPLQYFKIFVSYLQVMSSFLGFHVVWPSSIVSVMMWCKVTLNFNFLSLPGVSCLWKGISYNSKLTIYTLVPVIFGFMLWVPVLLISFFKYIGFPVEKRIISTIQDRFWNAIMFISFMVFCSFVPSSAYYFYQFLGFAALPFAIKYYLRAIQLST
jgi:hypothetical protein